MVELSERLNEGGCFVEAKAWRDFEPVGRASLQGLDRHVLSGSGGDDLPVLFDAAVSDTQARWASARTW